MTPTSNTQVERIGSNYIFRFDFVSATQSVSDKVTDKVTDKVSDKVTDTSVIPSSSSADEWQYREVCVPIFVWGYDALVSAIVRNKYSANDIEAIMLNNDAEELATLEAWRDHAKAIAAHQFGLDKTLERAKADKIKALEKYDKSSAVNEFFFGLPDGETIPYWMSLQDRTQLCDTSRKLLNAGQTERPIWIGKMRLVMPITQLLTIFDQVEVYAAACYDVTAGHRQNIEALTSIEEIEAYDFTQGYPDKPTF